MGGSFRRPKEAKIDPKCDPKRTKIEDKNEDENKTFFKIVLKRSWSHLGSFGEPCWGEKNVNFVAFKGVS